MKDFHQRVVASESPLGDAIQAHKNKDTVDAVNCLKESRRQLSALIEDLEKELACYVIEDS